MPAARAIGGAEQCCIFNPGVNGVRIGERRFQVPNALEFPGTLRAVVPLMGGERRSSFRRGVVNKLVARSGRWSVGIGHLLAAGRAPGPAAVVGTLNDLPEPAARLRSVDALRVRGRAFEMVDLPASEVRPVHLPALARAVGSENEGALPRSYEESYTAHV